MTWKINYSTGLLLFMFIHLFLKMDVIAQVIELHWTPNGETDLSHYRIYRSVHMDSGFALIDTVIHPDTAFVDENIQLNSTYFYAVTVVDSAGNESDFSNISEVETYVSTPVELTTFSGHIEKNAVILEWSTATESNNFGFEVQKSKDGLAFTKIGFVQGHGTTVTQNRYQFVDSDMTQDMFYYRLKQMDTNGDFEFSNVIQISTALPDEFHLFQNYPNPFNPETTISYNLPRGSHVDLTIYNVNGQQVRKLIDEFQKAGKFTVTWDGTEESGAPVSSGVYFYRIKALHSAIFRKMIFAK